MNEKDLAPHEKRAVEIIRAMVAKRFGKMAVIVHDGSVDIQGGPAERFKLPSHA